MNARAFPTTFITAGFLIAMTLGFGRPILADDPPSALSGRFALDEDRSVTVSQTKGKVSITETNKDGSAAKYRPEVTCIRIPTDGIKSLTDNQRRQLRDIGQKITTWQKTTDLASSFEDAIDTIGVTIVLLKRPKHVVTGMTDVNVTHVVTVRAARVAEWVELTEANIAGDKKDKEAVQLCGVYLTGRKSDSSKSKKDSSTSASQSGQTGTTNTGSLGNKLSGKTTLDDTLLTNRFNPLGNQGTGPAANGQYSATIQDPLGNSIGQAAYLYKNGKMGPQSLSLALDVQGLSNSLVGKTLSVSINGTKLGSADIKTGDGGAGAGLSLSASDTVTVPMIKPGDNISISVGDTPIGRGSFGQ